jgi:hypothetical protein
MNPLRYLFHPRDKPKDSLDGSTAVSLACNRSRLFKSYLSVSRWFNPQRMVFSCGKTLYIRRPRRRICLTSFFVYG